MLYRVRNALNYANFNLRTRAVWRTPPVPSEPGAGCELHTMLSARDLPLYLIAAKSLLRFYPSLAVVVHSDRTLKAGHEASLRHHLPGCRIVAAEEADERARRELGTGSFLLNCREFDASYRRLIDTELWSSAPKRIILDSDVLVLQRPEEVIAWVERGDGSFLMGQPPAPSADTAAAAPAGPKHVQTIFKENLGRIGAALGQEPRFLDGGTGGFYGCGEELSLDRVESLVRACLDLGLPMRDWGADQCVLIYLLSGAGAIRLDPGRYMNFLPDCIGRLDQARVLHFIGTFRFYRNVYADLACRAIADLPRAGFPVKS
ncbi:MAG TPA: hypothetical protein VF590_10945 [Isosphaeraceae bacterium]|jgi:hypothetical protein